MVLERVAISLFCMTSAAHGRMLAAEASCSDLRAATSYEKRS